jgi:hypothetical protein
MKFAKGIYKSILVADTVAEVIDGDSECVIFIKSSPSGSYQTMLENELFEQSYMAEKDWAPSPYMDLITSIAKRIDEDPSTIEKLDRLLEVSRARLKEATNGQ